MASLSRDVGCRSWSRRQCSLGVLLIGLLAPGALILFFKKFHYFGTTNTELAACSNSTCSEGSTEPCLWTDSPCQGSFCNQRCDVWRKNALQVPICTCEGFCNDKCFSPTCEVCGDSELPVWIRGMSGPLGTGLLCCPSPDGKVIPCCDHGNLEKNECCELVQPKCDCGWNKGVSLKSFLLPLDLAVGAFVVFAVLLFPTLTCYQYRRPLPKSHGPRGADILLLLSYVVALIACLILTKFRWERQFRPPDILAPAAVGRLAVFALSVVLLPLDRTRVLFIITHVPFERAVKWHRFAGVGAVALVLLHGILEAYVLGIQEMFTLKVEPWGLGNLFGLIACGSGVALVILSCWCIRRAQYEIFLYTHRCLAAVFFICGALHCFYFAPLALACFAFLGLCHAARWSRRSGLCKVVQCRRFGAEDVDSEVVMLCVEKNLRRSGRQPPGAGAWFLIQIPGSRQWHPYSLAAENDGTITFLIKNMGHQTWSSNIVKDPPSNLRIEGPYGGVALHEGDCDSLVLVGGGVGLTPLARLWKDPPSGISRVELVWVVRCPEALDWLDALLPSSLRDCVFVNRSIHIFVTKSSGRARAPSRTWAAGVTDDDEIVTHRIRGPSASSWSSAADSIECGYPMLEGVEVQLGSYQKSSMRQSSEEVPMRSLPEPWLSLSSAVQSPSELVKQAASLPVEPEASPTFVRQHLSLKVGRPDFRTLFGELNLGGAARKWAALACGPQQLVDDVRTSAYAQGFLFHAEHFEW